MRGLSLVAASGGHSSSRCAGLSLSRPLLLRSTGSSRTGSVVVARGPDCSAARGILPDQGSNPCLLHWQADSQPLRHQGSPHWLFIVSFIIYFFESKLWYWDIVFHFRFTDRRLVQIELKEEAKDFLKITKYMNGKSEIRIHSWWTFHLLFSLIYTAAVFLS